MAYQSKHTGTIIDNRVDLVSSIQTQVNTNTTDITNLTGKVNTNTTNITNLTSTHTTDINTINTTLNTINTTLNNKAPMYQYSTTDIGAGAALATGTIYLVYS